MRFPGLAFREPIRRRPVYGAFIGGLTGAIFAAINALDNSFPATVESVAAGYVLGGLVVGAIVGALAPQFRNRWIAGIIVATAMSVGFLIAVPLWGEDWGVPLMLLMGVFSGIVYAGLFWQYQPPTPQDGQHSIVQPATSKHGDHPPAT